MSGVQNSDDRVNKQSVNGHAPSEMLWCVSKIAPVIGRTERQTNHMLAAGRIKSARKIGGVWFANRTALLREFDAA
jgi:hypothetical protein